MNLAGQKVGGRENTSHRARIERAGTNWSGQSHQRLADIH